MAHSQQVRLPALVDTHLMAVGDTDVDLPPLTQRAALSTLLAPCQLEDRA